MRLQLNFSLPSIFCTHNSGRFACKAKKPSETPLVFAPKKTLTCTIFQKTNRNAFLGGNAVQKNAKKKHAH